MKRSTTFVSAVILGALFSVVLALGNGWAQWAEDSSAPIQEWTQTQSSVVLDPTDELDGVAEAAPIQLVYDSNLRITGSALRPRSSNVDWSAGSGCIYADAGDKFTVFNTPVYLPQGAVVKQVRMYYYDTNIGVDTIGWFSVYNSSGIVVDEWPVVSSGSSGLGYQDTEVFAHEVNYGSYSYLINWLPKDLGSDVKLCGFRIFYVAPTVKAPKVEVGPLN